MHKKSPSLCFFPALTRNVSYLLLSLDILEPIFKFLFHLIKWLLRNSPLIFWYTSRPCLCKPYRLPGKAVVDSYIIGDIFFQRNCAARRTPIPWHCSQKGLKSRWGQLCFKWVRFIVAEIDSTSNIRIDSVMQLS